jgi:hypothetical protein
MAASIMLAGATILASLFIWFLPVVIVRCHQPDVTAIIPIAVTSS